VEKLVTNLGSESWWQDIWIHFGGEKEVGYEAWPMQSFPQRYHLFQAIVVEGRVTKEAARIKINGNVRLVMKFPYRCCEIRVMILGWRMRQLGWRKWKRLRWNVSEGEYCSSKGKVNNVISFEPGSRSEKMWGGGPALLSPTYLSTFAHLTLLDTKKNHSLDV
jgi:hypothetical protein